MPAQGASNYLLRVNWTISGSDYKSCEDIGHNSDSSQQHARTGGVKLSVTCELDYLRDIIRTAHSSMPAQGVSNYLLRVN